MHVRAFLVQPGISNDALLHGLGQRIPGTEILPLSGKAQNSDVLLMLHNSIVKANLFQRVILCKEIVVIRKINQLVCAVKHITELVRKDAAIPQSTGINILLCRRCIRLFFERINL